MLLLTLDEGLAEVGLPQFFFYHFLFSSDGHQEYFGLLTTGAGCTWPGFSLWHCPRSQKTQDKWANLTSANGHTPPYWNLHHHRHNYFGNKHTTNLSSLLQILLRQSFLWILSCVLRKLFLTWFYFDYQMALTVNRVDLDDSVRCVKAQARYHHLVHIREKMMMTIISENTDHHDDKY